MDSGKAHRTMLAQKPQHCRQLASTCENLSVPKPLLYYTDGKHPSLGQEHHAPCLPSVSWQSRGLLCSLTDRTHFCRDFPETETPLNVRHAFNTLLLCGCYGLEPVSEEIMANTAHKLFQQRNTLGCVSGPAWHLRKHFGFFHCFSSSFHNPRNNAELKGM